ncbi:MAG: helix-turn-helix transcriptional regulator [Beijerinckiaceae bacterium]|nr:helix-turn-helix transcriptional regulator [Beijerinckiaceae bacterium]
MGAPSSLSLPVKRKLAAIRRLCCLGLGGQIAVPALLSELHALIPSANNYFMWAGPDLEMSNFYGEGAILQSVPLYLSEFVNNRELDVTYTFPEIMRRNRKSEVMTFPESNLKVDLRTFKHHDFYNLILRPHGIDFAQQLNLSEHGRGLGVLVVPRQNGDPEFTDRDRTLMEWIAPFAAHALAPGRPDEQLVESDDRGLIIATPAGEIEHLSPQARHLLMLATHPELSFAAISRAGPGPALPLEVAGLCQNLVEIFEDKAPLAPPVCQITNPWGAFTFRAYWLDRGAGPGASPLIGVTAERLEPLALKLWRRAEELPLTGREIEVCQLLAAGSPRGEIAERLGVSENTAINHCRNLYDKLGVHSRAELVEKLQAQQ